MDIQIVPFELKLRQKKWLVVLDYKPSAQNATYFLNCLPQIIDFYSIAYKKQVIIGNFNLTTNSKNMREFMDLYNLINLIKTTTCFKGTGSCIDLLLTNQNYSFKNANAFEIDFSDHHFLSELHTPFSKDSFVTDLSNSIKNSHCYEVLESKTIEVFR